VSTVFNAATTEFNTFWASFCQTVHAIKMKLLSVLPSSLPL